MPDKLVRLFMEFANEVKQFRNKQYESIEKMEGLTERSLAILDCIYQKGEATFADISKSLKDASIPRSSPSTVSNTITSLFVDHELVEKRINPKDQRQPIIVLTDHGKRVVEEVAEKRKAMFEAVKDAMQLNEKEMDVLYDVYKRGIDNFKVLNQ